MTEMASQITSLMIIYSTVYSDADQRKHQSSAGLAFVWGINRGPVNSPHKWPVTRQMFPFDDVIMILIMTGHLLYRYNDVIMSAMASQITILTIVYSGVYSAADGRKHQSSASLAFLRRIHRWTVNSPDKGPVTQKMSSSDDAIMTNALCVLWVQMYPNT